MSPIPSEFHSCEGAVGHANTTAAATLFNHKIERAGHTPIGAFAARSPTVLPEEDEVTMLDGATTVQPTLFEDLGDGFTELEEATTVQPDAPYEPTELPEEFHEWDALSL